MVHGSKRTSMNKSERGGAMENGLSVLVQIIKLIRGEPHNLTDELWSLCITPKSEALETIK